MLCRSTRHQNSCQLGGRRSSGGKSCSEAEAAELTKTMTLKLCSADTDCYTGVSDKATIDHNDSEAVFLPAESGNAVIVQIVCFTLISSTLCLNNICCKNETNTTCSEGVSMGLLSAKSRTLGHVRYTGYPAHSVKTPEMRPPSDTSTLRAQHNPTSPPASLHKESPSNIVQHRRNQEHW